MSLDPESSVGAICVGDIKCYPIPDGNHLYPRTALCGDDPERAIGLLEQILVPYTPLLVDTGAQRILIDSGAGPMAPSTGHLEESLSRAGFHVSDIDVVVLSHLHPDHIGGLALEDEGFMSSSTRQYESTTGFCSFFLNPVWKAVA
ncbi:MAG: MBL fold metallo-hydrolase [Silvibacterium sp.]